MVIVIQENHTFDAYFGSYCKATAGSKPTCTTGPTCCEAAPAKDPAGNSPVTLDDAANATHDPDHTQACELAEMHGGLMDRYVSGASGCSNAGNFAVAQPTLVAPYHQWAGSYALADRYFQPIVGQSSSNDMYFAVADYVFTDNDDYPDSIGKGCSAGITTTKVKYQGKTTIGDLLIQGGHDFAFYAEGYAAMKASTFCPAAPADCPAAPIPTNPCAYDPGDVPFEYYAQFTDNPTYMKDYNDFVAAVGQGSLPAVSFIKGMGYHNEHPGFGTNITQGVGFVKGIVDSVLASSLANDTLVLVTWDEGGGFFDHVAPPAANAADGQPYGTRIPLIAIGRFARKNHVSHVTLEHSSIVKLIEYNFLGETGQLQGRDTVVNNLGSLLDPAETGITIPED